MLEILVELDTLLFLLINSGMANIATDAVMPILRSSELLRAMYGVAMVMLLWKGNAKMRWLVLFSALVLLLTDQTAAKFLKPLIDRPRPCHVLQNINLLVNCGGGKSMPSAHAANAFGQAALFALTFPQIRWYLWTFAALVSIAQVFVGVHYPADILVGALIGTIIGVIIARLFKNRLSTRLPGLRHRPDSEENEHQVGDRDHAGNA